MKTKPDLATNFIRLISILVAVVMWFFLGTSNVVQAQGGAPSCDPPVYHGIQHCVSPDGKIHTLVIDLTNPHVRFQTVLPVNQDGLECNSVNGTDKDSESNCPYPYPLEYPRDMLARYVDRGVVALINTDYFGCDGRNGPLPCGSAEAHWGAQVLAVRNGVRLDGPSHNDHDSNEWKEPSLAIAPWNKAQITIPGATANIDGDLSATYYNTVGGSPIIVEPGGHVTGNAACGPAPMVEPYNCNTLGQSGAGLTTDGQLILGTTASDAQHLATYLTDHFAVDTALKFDGGGSAQLVWLDKDGVIQSFLPKGERRVAEGLAVFSSPISAPGIEITVEAPMPPQAPTRSEPIHGIGIGLQHFRIGIDELPTVLDRKQLQGIRWVREEIPWALVEPKFGQFQWSGDFQGHQFDYHRLLNELEQRNIQVVALLDYGPPYDPTATPYGRLDLWRGYVQRVVEQFGDQIDAWEIGNEMNSPQFWGKVVNYPERDAKPDPAFYAQMLRIAYNVIKADDPKDTVIVGGLIAYHSDDCATNPFQYLYGLYAAGAWDAFDAIAFHPYWGANAPETTLARGPAHIADTGACWPHATAHYRLVEEVRALAALTERLGPKPIWITEIGWSQAQMETIAGDQWALVQADYLVRTYVPLLSEPGVETVIWYTLEDDPHDTSGTFALQEPGRLAMQNLAKLLIGSRPLGQVNAPDERNPGDDDFYEYRFQKGDQLIVAIWKARGGDEIRRVAVDNLTIDGQPAASVRVSAAYPSAFDTTIGEQQRTPDNGSIIVDLTERPLLIVAERRNVWDNFWHDLNVGFGEWWDNVLESIAQWPQDFQEGLAERWQGMQQNIHDWLTDRQRDLQEQLANLERAIQRQIDQMWKEIEKEAQRQLDNFWRRLEESLSKKLEGICSGPALAWLPFVGLLLLVRKRR